MGQHISRKELKKDEVRETFAQGAEAVLSHQKLTIYLLAVAIVLALGVFGWKTYSERQTVKHCAYRESRRCGGQDQVPVEREHHEENP